MLNGTFRASLKGSGSERIDKAKTDPEVKAMPSRETCSPFRTRPRRVVCWRLLAAIGLVTLVACSESETPSGPTGSDEEVREVSFRFDVSAAGYDAPFVLAEEQGWYADEGLTVTFGEGTGSDVTGPLVAEGEDEFGLVDFATAVQLISQGMPDIVAVATISPRIPLAILTLEESGIEEPADLEGRTVVMGSGDVGLWQAFTEATGIDESAVEIVNVDEGSQAQVLMEGTVDGLLGYVTFQLPQIEELGGELNPLNYADYGVNVMSSSIFASEEYLESDRETVCGFVRGSMRGWEAAMEDPTAAIDALVDMFPNVSRSIMTAQLENSFELLFTESNEEQTLGWIAEEDVTETIETLTEFGDLESAPEPSALYTNECLEE